MVGIYFPSLAQQSQSLFEQLTEKHAEQDGFSASMLSNDMFDLYLKKKNIDEDSELADALNALDNILVISQSKFEVDYEANFFAGKKTEPTTKAELDDLYKEIVEHYKQSGYALFKTEKKMGEDVKVYLQKEDGEIRALALLTNSNASTNLVELEGYIDLTKVASLSKVINLRGLENLYKIDGSNSFYGRFPAGVYPAMSQGRIAELEEQALEMTKRNGKLSDEQVAKIEKQAQVQFEKQREMVEKYREMAEKYGRQPIFLSTPGDTSTIYYIDGKKVKGDEVKSKLKEGEMEQITVDEKDGKTIIKIRTKKK